VQFSCSIKQQLCLDYLDIRVGNWAVAIKDIQLEKSIESKIPQTLFPVQSYNITCNLVDGKRLNDWGAVEHFLPPIQRIRYNVLERKLTHFPELCWFLLTSKSSFLELNLEPWPITSVYPLFDSLEVDVSATLLFKRLE
jgi:hypothetical protein